MSVLPPPSWQGADHSDSITLITLGFTIGYPPRVHPDCLAIGFEAINVFCPYRTLGNYTQSTKKKTHRDIFVSCLTGRLSSDELSLPGQTGRVWLAFVPPREKRGQRIPLRSIWLLSLVIHPLKVTRRKEDTWTTTTTLVFRWRSTLGRECRNWVINQSRLWFKWLFKIHL